MKIAIGSDHAGFRLKEAIKKYLIKRKIEFKDFGAYSEESVDYPDIAFPVAKAVANKRFDRGILICGSGQGMQMAANRVEGVRAAPCTDTWFAKMSRAHNDANVLTLGQRNTKPENAVKIVKVWLKTDFEGGRHLRRVKKLMRGSAAIKKKYSFYLDTSIPNFFFEKADKNKRKITKDFFRIIKKHKNITYISYVVLKEIKRTRNTRKKVKLLELVKRFKKLKMSDEALRLAQKYMKTGIIPHKYEDDAFHIALATVKGLEVLVSWNFKHIVKLKTKLMVNAINLRFGYGIIELITPEEVI